MTSSAEVRRGRLVAATDPFEVRSLASAAEVVAGLATAGLSWGFFTTPSDARLLLAPTERWAELAAHPHLQELRVFGPEGDRHWREGSGVALTPAPADSPPGLAGAAGWWQRDRRSRLWGELLEGTLTWYEERIPDRQVYQGLVPAAGQRYAFLLYREYVQAGAVRYVRFLDVVGGAR